MHPRGWFTLALLCVAGPWAARRELHAQGTASPPGIRAGAWRYAAHAAVGAGRQDLGSRTVRITPIDSRGTSAWLVVMTMQVEGQPLIDSVVMRRADLHPISRHTIAPQTDLTVVVGDTVAHGLLTARSSVVPINVPLGARSFLNYYSLRAAFQELPLAAAWEGQASVLELVAEPTFAPLTLAVVADERVTVPAGEYDCWHVVVSGPDIEEHYWIGKADHDVIRSREAIGTQGAVMQLDLVSFTPYP